MLVRKLKTFEQSLTKTFEVISKKRQRLTSPLKRKRIAKKYKSAQPYLDVSMIEGL